MATRLFSEVEALQVDPVVSAAWLYYHLGLTQADIAETLKISRTSVVNLLAEARERGIVTIRIEPEYLSSLNLAQTLRERFGLRDALVVPTPHSADVAQIRSAIGQACALYLERVIRPGDILATGWGYTLLAAAKALRARPVPGLTVAQLIGGFSSSSSLNPSSVVSLIADKLQARRYFIYMPAAVASPEIRSLLLSDPAIRAGLEVAKTANRALVGIGKVSQNATVVEAGFVSSVEIDELRAKGAVGDLMSRYFDISGKPVRSSFDDRLTGLTFDELRAIARVRNMIAAVGGSDKVEAILGALRSGLIHILISDERTIQAVLQLDEETRLLIEGDAL